MQSAVSRLPSVLNPPAAMEVIDGHGQVPVARADVSYADPAPRGNSSPTKAGHVANIIESWQNAAGSSSKGSSSVPVPSPGPGGLASAVRPTKSSGSAWRGEASSSSWPEVFNEMLGRRPGPVSASFVSKRACSLSSHFLTSAFKARRPREPRGRVEPGFGATGAALRRPSARKHRPTSRGESRPVLHVAP